MVTKRFLMHPLRNRLYCDVYGDVIEIFYVFF
jgi:hypothetical protein